MDALISLLILVLVVGIIVAVIVYCIDMLPIDGRFRQIARVLVLLIAVLIILARSLPMLGVAV